MAGPESSRLLNHIGRPANAIAASIPVHILFLTDNFPPEVNAPASRTFEHCREWVRAGHRVTVITCAPNFPQGKVYPGYQNRMWQVEEMDGIRVIRVWSYITANEGFIKRILDYFSFMISATLSAVFVRKPDIVIGTSPQFFTACAAYTVSRMKRIPFVFELRDLWPETIKTVGAIANSTTIQLLEKVEMFLYRKAARIISVTESFKRTLIQRGIDGKKINVVTNGVDINHFMPMPKEAELLKRHGLETKFVAGYVGTIGVCHELETVLEAAYQLQQAGEYDIRIVLLGHGARKQVLVAKSKAMNLENIIFIDSVSKEEVSRYWALLDVSIIHLKKTSLFTTVIPSKLFECMAMGIPTLHGVLGESAEIVEREGVGIVFEPENASALVASLIKLRDDHKLYHRMRANNIVAAPKYDRTILAERMLRMLIEITASGCRIVDGKRITTR